MNDKIDIAGLALDNCSAADAVWNVQNSMEQNGMFAVAQIDADIVMEAARNTKIKNAVEKLDQTIIADWTLLKAIGKEATERKSEIENSLFFYEIMDMLEKKQWSLAIVASSENICKEFSDGIAQQFPGVKIVGTIALEKITGAVDAVLNEMNALAPDVILNIMPSVEMIEFFDEHRDKIFVKMWYGMGEKIPGNKENFWKIFSQNRKKLRDLRKYI